jgi:hypothetical protein
VILTSKNSTARFHTINVRNVNKTTGKKIYKIFSNEVLTTSDLATWFNNMTDSQSYHWEGVFPSMKPLKQVLKYQPIRLHENLYYINGIEELATAMGGSVLASENIAKLIVKDTSKRNIGH